MVDIPANHVWLPEDLRIGMPYLYIFNLLTLIVGSISWPFTSRGSNAIWSQHGLGIHCFNLFGPVSGKCCAFLLEAKSTQRKSCMQFKPCCAVSGKKKHQYLTHSVSESCQTTAAYIHGLFLHFMRFEISKAMLITSVFAFHKQKICNKTHKKILFVVVWRCHGQELLIYISISASEVCKTHLFVVFLAFHFFLTLLFQNSAICGVSASLLSKTGLVAFLCAPTKDAATGQLGMCLLGWLLRAAVPSVNSQIFQILFGWFWYKQKTSPHRVKNAAQDCSFP